MRKLLFVLIAAFTLVSVNNAQKAANEDLNTQLGVQIRLRAIVGDVPSVLDKSYANGWVVFQCYYSGARGYEEIRVPYTGANKTYYASFTASSVPQTISHRVKLEVTTKYNDGMVHQLYWWNGEAMAESVYHGYQSYYNCNIDESDFYNLEQGGMIHHHVGDITK